MATITKKDLIDRIAQESGLTRSDVKKVIQTFLDAVIDELEQDNRCEFRDFGVFEVRERAERNAQNPKTLERVVVPPRRVVKFKAGRKMQDAVREMKPSGVVSRPARPRYDDDDDS